MSKERTQQSKRRRELKRAQEILRARSNRLMSHEMAPRLQQAKIDKKRKTRQRLAKMSPDQRAYARKMGQRQFSGANPEHNKRHGMPVPQQQQAGPSDG